MQKNKFSLWLRPSQKKIDELTKIISKLSHHYGTTPFPPHITLLSGIEIDLGSIINTCKKISKQYKKFPIPLLGLDFTESFYRNLYIQAEKTPVLLELYEDITRQLKTEPKEEFLPHLSLLYGNIDPASKDKIKAKLEQAYTDNFHCQRLDIYATHAEIQTWHLIQAFELA